MAFNYTNRVLIAILFFTLTTLYSTAMTLITIPPVKLNNYTRNSVFVDVSYFDESRFDGVKAMLSKNATVGYLPVKPLNDPDMKPKEFYLAQYAISPILLTYSTTPAFVIGDFTNQQAARAAIKNFILVKDFGNGVLLLRHNPV